jgi:hypothetical protein
LRPQERKTVLDAFDALGKGTVAIEKRRLTFQQVYDRMVEATYAEDFLAKLLARELSERETQALEQQTAQDMLAMLEQEGFITKRS